MSEILKEYAKIAQAQGLIDMEAPTGGQEKKPPRYDSLTWDDIQMLYGVTPKGQEAQTLLDKAHPDTYVVGRAYDAMNAVVENLNQRQNVMADIALRTPDGLLTQKRYVKAHHDLMQSLVRIGFEMDNKEEARLMKMADSCAGRLQKTAFVPWLIAGAVALGLLGWANYADDAVQGVYQNAQNVIDQAEDLLEKGSPWAAALIEEMQTLQKYAAEFGQVTDALMQETGGQITPEAATKVTHERQDLLVKAQRYQAILHAELKNLKIWKTKVKYDKSLFTTEESSWNITKWWEKAKSLVVDTEEGDVEESIGGLEKTIAETLKQIAGIKQWSAQHAQNLEQAEQEWQQKQQSGGAQVAQAPAQAQKPEAGLVNLETVGQPQPQKG
jgi:acylphosphatase